MRNEWDKLIREAVRQARVPSQGVRMGTTEYVRRAHALSSTLQDSDGHPLRLWMPGRDPWGVGGYYFGDRKLG